MLNRRHITAQLSVDCFCPARINEPNPYADIIDLPHHVPQMPKEKRAAQFSHFAAVSGHDEAIHETSRFTEEQLELSEDEIADIDRNFQWLREHIKEQPEIIVTYFRPDEKKTSGAYVTVTGSAKMVGLKGM